MLLRPSPRPRPLLAGVAAVALGLGSLGLPGLLGLSPQAAAAAGASTPRAVSSPGPLSGSAGGVFVWYEQGATTVQRSAALHSAGLATGTNASVAPAVPAAPLTETVQVPAGSSAEQVAADLRAHSGVRFAIPSLPIRRTGAPDALADGSMWGLRNDAQVVRDAELGVALRGVHNIDVDAPEAWATTRGRRSTLVGVIDSGVDITHPDLAASIWTNPRPVSLNPARPTQKDLHGWDFCHNDGSVYDPEEFFDDGGVRESNDLHGTHVAGTIAAADDQSGSVGVAPEVTIVPLKVFGVQRNGDQCTSDGIFQALVYAALHGVKIINASWSIEEATASDRAEIDDLFTALGDEYGMVIVAAAGNGVVDSSGADVPINIDEALAAEAAGQRGPQVPYPAASRAPNVITVGAVDNRGRLAPFSNVGHHTVDILAPGVSVWSTVPGNVARNNYSRAYGFLSGTSMATPHVTAEAAMLRSVGTLPAAEVVRRIVANGKPLRALPPLVTLTNDMADSYDALKPASAIRVTVVPPSVRSRGKALVTATLRDGVTWRPRASQLLTACLRVHGARRWACTPALRADASGRAAIAVSPLASLDVQWRFRGAPSVPAVSSSVVVVGVKRAVSLRLDRSVVSAGASLHIRGRVSDAVGGELVQLQQLQGDRYRTLLVGRVRRDGVYTFTARLSRLGAWRLRAYVPASDGFTASASSSRALRVR